MEHYIEMKPLDLSVYGQVQYNFTVAGKEGTFTFGEAAVNVASKRAAALEIALPPLRNGLKQKMEKLSALSLALGDIAKIVAELCQEGMESDKKVKIPDTSIKTLRTYEVPGVPDSGEVKKSEAYTLQQNIKLEIEKENTQLQETTSVVQSFIQKRDSAFGLIGKIQQKVDHTSQSTIQSIGGD